MKRGVAVCLQDTFVNLRFVAAASVRHDGAGKVVGDGVQGRSQHAYMGGHTHNDDRFDVPETEGLVQVRLEEGAEAPLFQYGVSRLGRQFRDDLHLLGPADGVLPHAAFEDKVPPKEAIAGVDHGISLRPRLFQERLNHGDDLSRLLREGASGFVNDPFSISTTIKT